MLGPAVRLGVVAPQTNAFGHYGCMLLLEGWEQTCGKSRSMRKSPPHQSEQKVQSDAQPNKPEVHIDGIGFQQASPRHHTDTEFACPGGHEERGVGMRCSMARVLRDTTHLFPQA
eukprot:6482682-Amphidinium_carterae.3